MIALVRGVMAASILFGSMVQVSRINVNENRRGSGVSYGRGTRDKGEADSDYFIAWSNSGRQESKVQCAGAGVYSERESRLTVVGKISFKRFNLLAQYEVRTLDHL